MANCPICETVDCKEFNSGKPDAVRFDCKRCGEFDVTGTVLAVLPNALAGGIHRRALMSHVIRQMKGLDASPRPLIVSDKLESYWLTDRLPPPSAQADRLILLSGDKQLSPEDPIRFAAYFLDAWVGASLTTSGDPHAGVQWLLWHLLDEKLLNWHIDSDDGWNRIYRLQLTMRGWEKFAQLKETRINSRTAFMAMKFGDAQLEDMVESCFKPAVNRAGFELKKLTDEQPAGLIDDQIRASILSARFVIADLTHGSHGAYWEAGFAEGLNLPVIYTCEKTLWEERKTHFDTNHMLKTIWDAAKPKETGDALTATVRATLRAEARQQD